MIELASKGNPQNVDVYTDALFKVEGACDDDKSLYTKASQSKTPGIIYCFGKAVGAKIGNHIIKMSKTSLGFIINTAHNYK